MLTIETKANGALFNTEPEGRNPNGPVMTGTLDVADQKVRVAAFLKAAKESGKNYLSIKIGDERKQEPIFHGKLFASEDKRGEKSPDYTGYISLEASDDAPHLRIAGWKKVDRNGKPFISIEVAAPRKVSSDEASEALPI